MTYRPTIARESDPEWMSHHQYDVQHPAAVQQAASLRRRAVEDAERLGVPAPAALGRAIPCPGSLRFIKRVGPVWVAQCDDDRCGYTIGVRTENLDREGLVRKRLQRAALPGAFIDTRLQKHAGNEDAFEVCRLWAERFDDAATALAPPLLHGPTGTGKTHLLARTVAHVIREHLADCRYWAMPDLFAELRARMHGGDTSADEMVASVSAVQVLVLDDLGANQSSPWAIEVLERIVDHRERHGLALLAATNVAPDRWAAELGARTESRLRGMCNVTAVTGEDWRKTHRAEQAPAGNVVPLPVRPNTESSEDDDTAPF